MLTQILVYLELNIGLTVSFHIFFLNASTWKDSRFRNQDDLKYS